MKIGDIVFSRDNSILAYAIRWWTHSKWNHVAAVISCSEVIEATFSGVIKRKIDCTISSSKQVLMTNRIPLSEEQESKLVEYLNNCLGRPYDWLGLLSFFIKKNISNKSFYFCSKLVAEAFEKINKPLLRREPSWITPQDLWQSLELKEFSP